MKPLSQRRLPSPIALPAGGRLDRFDGMVDEVFEARLRGRGLPDTVFYVASAVGDHGLLWLAIAGIQAARWRDPAWRRRLRRAAAGLGVESALVNGPVKWMFRRERPALPGPRDHYLRQPRTSSFPSGHATAAFFAAALLRDGDGAWPLYYGLAVIVAASRVHVRIHHASDVVGGAVLGALLGELTRALVPVDPPAADPPVAGPPVAVAPVAGSPVAGPPVAVAPMAGPHPPVAAESSPSPQG